MDGVEQWLKDNLGIILGVCTGVAVIEVSCISCLIMETFFKGKAFFSSNRHLV